MNKRKLLFMLFMTMLMMMLCPQRMWADWTYDATAGTITDGTNTIDNITCSDTELTIGHNSDKTFGDLDLSLPVKDSGGNTYTITVISNSAFYNCTFNSLKLPNELTTIGVNAFCYHTVNNGSITISASVTSIGKSAFGASRNLDSFVVESGNANYCVYDGMLYDINKETLMACPGSRTGSVVLPNTVKTIQDDAFYNSKITSITLPESLTTIGDRAFRYSSITSITIPKGVTSIGDVAFCECSSLSAINVEEGNTIYCSLDGILYSYDKKTLIACPAGYTTTSVKIPDGVVTVQSDAFAYNTSLKSVEIPSSVTNIGSSTFWYASNLATITCNATTPPTLDDYAFYHIASGAKVIVPEASVDAYKAASNWSSMNIVANVPYTVSFNLNGHGSAIDAQAVTIFCTAVEPTVPTEEGYTFGGWFTEEECTNTYDFTTVVTDNITLYAKWICNHNFDTDGKCTRCGITVTLSLAESSISLDKGDEKTLTVSTNAESSQLTWTSSDENVATVDATGKVTAKALGESDITVKLTGTSISATCHVTVATIVYMPTSGSQDIALAAGESITIYDDGGADNNYSNNCDGTINLTAPEGYLVKITGTCNAEGRGYDELLINGTQYDRNNDIAVGIDQATSNNCTIRFHSNNGASYAGFALTVTTVPFLSNIAYTTEKQTDGTYNVDFTFVNKDASAEYAVYEGTDVVGTINGGVTKFQFTGVEVGCHTYTFTNSTTSVNVVCLAGAYLVPLTGTNEVTLAAGEAIKIYDDGGPDKNYSNNCDGTINLTAPEGYIVRITGTCKAEGGGYDELLINGTQFDFEWDYDNNCRTAVAIDQTTDNNCTIRFYSDGGSNYAGFALTATAVPYSPIVKLNSAGYATYSSDVDFVVATEGVKAYKGTFFTTGSINGDTKIVLEEINGYIPAGTGVILYGENKANTSVAFKAPADGATAPDVSGNCFSPTTTATESIVTKPTTGMIWALGPTDNRLMQYTGDAFIANRAYLQTPEVTLSAKGYQLVFADEIDGINSIENGELEIENAAAYNIAGQRVKNNAKGIVIKNGKKYFVK